jgi:hypothetical protein
MKKCPSFILFSCRKRKKCHYDQMDM